MKKLVVVLFTAAMLWLANAISELGLLETSSVPLMVAALLHVLFAVSLWGVVLALAEPQRGAAGGAKILAAVAAGLTTAGHLALVWPPLTIVRSYTPDLLAVIRESNVATAGVFAVASGTLLLGVAWLMGNGPRWTGWLLVAGAPVPAAALQLGWPLWTANLAEIAMALALIGICIDVLPAPTEVRRADGVAGG